MTNILYETTKKIMTNGKGILASDERPSSANKNLEKAGIVPSDEMRRSYRDLFINTPDLEKYVSGIIIHDETFWQNDLNNKPFRETLTEKGILIVIKVDEGTTELPEFPGEKITLGLDGLKERLEKYYEAGARLAKWRSVIKIGNNIPTQACIEANATGLAEYASFCQSFNIVPIVEPEVLIDGDHTIEIAEEITTNTLNILFEKLSEYRVDIKGLILKSSMVIPGKESTQEVTPEQIAQATIRTFNNSVPKDLPGIVFLSGGQDAIEATENLNAIAKNEPLPWEIAFSYLRALEGSAAKIWQGKEENVDEARKEFIKRLSLNVLADKGAYKSELE
ncbi:class I fructose-bisphosphate aldolase [Patescibacteria group bacterium]